MKTGGWHAFVTAACLFCSWPALAGPLADEAYTRLADQYYARVDSVQMPAWLERNGMRQPLAPGAALQNRDRVFTGAEARLLIVLADGSTVKLAENSELHLNAFERRDGWGVAGALEVVRGAFRLTTGASAQQRAFNVRLATITAGLHTADLWGRAGESGALLCLLEGEATALHAKDETRYLSGPLDCYSAPQGVAPRPLDDVDAAQLGADTLLTEVQPGHGYAQRDGQWQAELMSFDTEAEAVAFRDRLRRAGYAASMQKLRVKRGIYRYAIDVQQLPSRDEASALKARIGKSM